MPIYASVIGPRTPESTIVALPQAAGPDFLVQVEAFAKTP
jgi:hypothetical protein